jgi:PIN domain
VRTNFLLIDLENVKPDNLGLVAGGQFKVKVFVGAHQKNVPFAMAQALQAFGPDAEYIQIDGHGRSVACAPLRSKQFRSCG